MYIFKTKSQNHKTDDIFFSTIVFSGREIGTKDW